MTGVAYFEFIVGLGIGIILSVYFEQFTPMVGIVSGDSMEPTIHQSGSSQYVCEPINTDEIEPGDVVVWSRDEADHAVMHRVVEPNDDTITTKGDGVQRRDPPVDKNDVLCRYLWHMRLSV